MTTNDRTEVSAKTAYDDFLKKLKHNSETKKQVKELDKEFRALKEPDKSPFMRQYSLTENEVKRMNEWQDKHFDKFHKKEDLKRYRKNPFYKGASPMGRFVVEFSSCSIGTGADCFCVECRDEYFKMKRKTNELESEENPDYKRIDQSRKKEKKLWDKCHFEIRSFDD